MHYLSDVVEVLYGPGQPMSGSEMKNDEAIAYVRQHCPQAPFCLVRDWVWVDLDVSDVQRADLQEARCQPVILYAHTVIHDSTDQWRCSDFVRTSPLHVFQDGFLFKTCRTVYVLLGGGMCKVSAPDVLERIL